MSQMIMCVVCEKSAAVVYCQQDDAHLCAACDHQVHSANQLASRHIRVPISQTTPGSESERSGVAVKDDVEGKGMTLEDDDDIFAVPDIDYPSGAQDEAALNTKALMGKEYFSDDFYLNDMDPLWLDRLDVGLDRLPSDILDSLVPEGPPASDNSEAVAPAPVASLPAPNAPKSADDASAMAAPAAPVAPANYMPTPHMVAMAPHVTYPQSMPNIKPEVRMAPLDIDSYVPRTLQPMDPALRAQLVASRQEKLQRFREKKANRHFKKTIRYASRKAYAEVRPRIKGRFARKDEVAAMRAAGVLPPV